MRRAATAPTCIALLVAVAAWPACGGGGGGTTTPVAPKLQLRIDDVVLGPGQQSATVNVHLTGLPANLRPVLLEADVLLDSQRLQIATSQPPLRALQPRPTVDGGVRGGSFHLLYGDGQNPAGLPMVAGPLFSVTLELRSPRSPGVVAVELANLLVVDHDGQPLPVETPVRGRVTVQ